MMHSRRNPEAPPIPGAPAAPPPPTARKAAFNVQMSPEDDARLDAVAQVLGRSRGACVREALRFLHQMTVQGIPTCASGQFCVVPNVHRPAPALPTPPAAGGER